MPPPMHMVTTTYFAPRRLPSIKKGAMGAQGGGVAFWAHVGGFVAGAVLIYFFRDKRLLDRHPYHGWRQRRAPTENWHKINRR